MLIIIINRERDVDIDIDIAIYGQHVGLHLEVGPTWPTRSEPPAPTGAPDNLLRKM